MELIGFIFLFFIATLILRVIIMFEDIIRTQDQEARAAYLKYAANRARSAASVKSTAAASKSAVTARTATSSTISAKAQVAKVNHKKTVTKLSSPRRTTAPVMRKVAVKAA